MYPVYPFMMLVLTITTTSYTTKFIIIYFLCSHNPINNAFYFQQNNYNWVIKLGCFLFQHLLLHFSFSELSMTVCCSCWRNIFSMALSSYISLPSHNSNRQFLYEFLLCRIIRENNCCQKLSNIHQTDWPRQLTIKFWAYETQS